MALLSSLQLVIVNKECPVSFRIKGNRALISYDETIVEKNRRLSDLKDNRVLGIDLNPNYIGLSILKFDKNNEF